MLFRGSEQADVTRSGRHPQLASLFMLCQEVAQSATDPLDAHFPDDLCRFPLRHVYVFGQFLYLSTADQLVTAEELSRDATCCHEESTLLS